MAGKTLHFWNADGGTRVMFVLRYPALQPVAPAEHTSLQIHHSLDTTCSNFSPQVATTELCMPKQPNTRTVSTHRRPLIWKRRHIHEHVCVYRKNFHSLNVQIICDANMQLLNVCSKRSGSTHNSFILGAGANFQSWSGGKKVTSFYKNTKLEFSFKMGPLKAAYTNIVYLGLKLHTQRFWPISWKQFIKI